MAVPALRSSVRSGDTVHGLAFSLIVGAMPTLPHRLAIVQVAVASLLWSPPHFVSLYSAADVTNTFNFLVDFNGSAAISTQIDVTLLLHAFANDAADEFVLAYDEVFGRRRDKNALYVQRLVKMGRHTWKDWRSMVLGRFILMEAGKRANTVPWYIAMDEDIRTGLVGFLEEALRRKKKRPVIDMSLETDEN